MIVTDRHRSSPDVDASMSAGIHGVQGNPRLGVAGSPGANLPSIWRTVKGQGPLNWPYIYVVNSGGDRSQMMGGEYPLPLGPGRSAWRKSEGVGFGKHDAFTIEATCHL